MVASIANAKIMACTEHTSNTMRVESITTTTLNMDQEISDLFDRIEKSKGHYYYHGYEIVHLNSDIIAFLLTYCKHPLYDNIK